MACGLQMFLEGIWVDCLIHSPPHLGPHAHLFLQGKVNARATHGCTAINRSLLKWLLDSSSSLKRPPGLSEAELQQCA